MVDSCIRKNDSTKYLALLHFDEKYKIIFDRITYLSNLKSNILDAYSRKYKKTKFNSNDDLPLQKTLNMQNAVILIKFILNKKHNHYYHETFLGKCSNKQYLKCYIMIEFIFLKVMMLTLFRIGFFRAPHR